MIYIQSLRQMLPGAGTLSGWLYFLRQERPGDLKDFCSFSELLYLIYV